MPDTPPGETIMLEGVKIDLQRRSLSEQVFQHIRRMILSEELHGGQRIPEERIAQTFGVSRTPIREAMRKLEKVGLVKIVPRSHAEVMKIHSTLGRSVSSSNGCQCVSWQREQLKRTSRCFLRSRRTVSDALMRAISVGLLRGIVSSIWR